MANLAPPAVLGHCERINKLPGGLGGQSERVALPQSGQKFDPPSGTDGPHLPCRDQLDFHLVFLPFLTFSSKPSTAHRHLGNHLLEYHENALPSPQLHG